MQIDKELASGEYFLKERQKKRKRVEEIKVKLFWPAVQLKSIWLLTWIFFFVPFALLYW